MNVIHIELCTGEEELTREMTCSMPVNSKLLCLNNHHDVTAYYY